MKKILTYTALGSVVVGLVILMSSWYIVSPGHQAIQVRMGKIVDVKKDSGFYWKSPLIDYVYDFDMRVCNASIETTSLTKDLQYVAIGIVINYRIGDCKGIYCDVGRDFTTTILHPYTQESMKAVVAHYNAEDLIRMRNAACDMLLEDLSKRLKPRYLELIDINFVHLDFHREFIEAVEKKQIAEQRAKEEHNLTGVVLEQMAQQKLKTDAEVYSLRLKAEAEAYSLEIQKKSATKELIEIKKLDVLARAIKAWDGKLPSMITGSFMGLLNGIKVD